MSDNNLKSFTQEEIDELDKFISAHLDGQASISPTLSDEYENFVSTSFQYSSIAGMDYDPEAVHYDMHGNIIYAPSQPVNSGYQQHPASQSPHYSNERLPCRNYPNCSFGNSCRFWHPDNPTSGEKQICKKYPNCQFGDKCRYMHPQSDEAAFTKKPCRFGVACRNIQACRFSHN